MAYDPEYINELKELFGDDYKKYVPLERKGGAEEPRPKPQNTPQNSRPDNANSYGSTWQNSRPDNANSYGSTWQNRRPDNQDSRRSAGQDMQYENPDSYRDIRQGGASGGFKAFDAPALEGAGNVWGSPAGDISEPEYFHEPDNFSVEFDFDSEYRDVPENRPLRQRRERRSGCLGGILLAAFVLCVSLLASSLLWLAATDVLGFGRIDEEVNVTVPKDFTIDKITDILRDGGIIKYKFLFKLYAGFSSAEEKITAGSYTLNRNYDYRAIVHGMMARSKTRVEVKVSIPEGYTLSQIFTLLENNGVCDADELWESAANYDYDYVFLSKKTLGDRRRLEGFLFPNTYNFYLESTPEQAISKLLNEFNRKFTQEYIERAVELGYSVREIVTIASLIEREAGVDKTGQTDERATIASVIYNRLNSPDFPRLEIDATIFYAIAGTGQSFSTELDNPYNTYKYEGLPPGPIANPGVDSIRAALYPETTDYYYYALNKSGMHNFFKTLSSHEAFVKSDEYGG